MAPSGRSRCGGRSPAVEDHGGDERMTRRAGQTPPDEALADRAPVTVVLRLVVDRRGRLVYGEVVDTELKTWGRFSTWRQLTPTVRRGLQEQGEGPGDAGDPRGEA
jgi:hypothetical protein